MKIIANGILLLVCIFVLGYVTFNVPIEHEWFQVWHGMLTGGAISLSYMLGSNAAKLKK